MSSTTIRHYEIYNRTKVPTELMEHVNTALQNAEDDFVRELGASFFDSEETIQGRDWLKIVSWRAFEYIRITSAEFQAAVGGPFQSETIGRYSYTLRTPADTVAENPRYRAVIDYYRGMTAPIKYRGVRTAVDEYAV